MNLPFAFLDQTFALPDIGVVFFLVLLEGLLSADNALVLAIMVKHLPKELRQKALLYGLGGAFIFRLIAILLASFLIKLWWLQAIGAIYLLYLPIKHFRSPPEDVTSAAKKHGFWKTVAVVEVADISFAIDSVLAGVAVVRGKLDKVWVVYVGAIFGIILLRFAASAFVKLLERYPHLDRVAYGLVFWVGVKLSFLAAHNYTLAVPDAPFKVSELHPAIFWTGMALICLIGGWYAVSKGTEGAGQKDELAEEARHILED